MIFLEIQKFIEVREEHMELQEETVQFKPPNPKTSMGQPITNLRK